MDERIIIWDFLTDNELATEEEIGLVTHICGYSVKALTDILECRTAYHSIEQCYNCEPDSFYFRDICLDYYGLNKDSAESEINE